MGLEDLPQLLTRFTCGTSLEFLEAGEHGRNCAFQKGDLRGRILDLPSVDLGCFWTVDDGGPNRNAARSADAVEASGHTNALYSPKFDSISPTSAAMASASSDPSAVILIS